MLKSYTEILQVKEAEKPKQDELHSELALARKDLTDAVRFFTVNYPLKHIDEVTDFFDKSAVPPLSIETPPRQAISQLMAAQRRRFSSIRKNIAKPAFAYDETPTAYHQIRQAFAFINQKAKHFDRVQFASRSAWKKLAKKPDRTHFILPLDWWKITRQGALGLYDHERTLIADLKAIKPWPDLPGAEVFKVTYYHLSSYYQPYRTSKDMLLHRGYLAITPTEKGNILNIEPSRKELFRIHASECAWYFDRLLRSDDD